MKTIIRTTMIYAISLLVLGFSQVAYADSCYLENLGASAAQVRVYDEDTGQLVWMGTIQGGGRSDPITVSEDRMRYEYKYAEDTDYHSNTGAWCQNGERVLF